MSLAHNAEPAAAGTVDTSESIKLFVSYSRADEQAVVRLIDALERKGGVEVLLDKTDILPSEEWRARLEALIAQADDVVFCVSPDSVASEVCAWEVTVATTHNKRIVPVVLRDTAAHAIPDAIARLNFIFARTQDPFDEAIDRLHFALGIDIDWIREHTRLGELARQWDRNGRRPADLLRGPALESAERWLSVQPREANAPTEVHRDFIRVSRLGATRRQRGWIIGSLTVAAVTSVLSILALWQRSEAVAQRTQANARFLAAKAQVDLSAPLAPPETAVQNLLVSLQLEKSEQANHALEIGVRRLQPEQVGTLEWPVRQPGPVLLRFSPNGAWLVGVTPQEIFVWNVNTRALRIRHAIDIGPVQPKVAFAPDSRHAMVFIGTNDQAATKQRVLTADLDNAKVSEHGFDRIYDAAATDSALRALVAGPAPTQIRVVELISGRTVWEKNFPRPVRLGRLRSGPPPSAQEVPTIPMMPIPMAAPTPALMGDVVLVDAAGHLSIWRFDQAQPVKAYRLPHGARSLSFGDRGSVIAVRRANGPIVVLDVNQGNKLWQAGADTSNDGIAFTGGDRFVAVQDPQGVRIHSLAGGFDLHVEHGRRTDFDVNAMANIERYAPFVDAQPVEDDDLLVTARKDGRVEVWRPSQKPRTGGVDAFPRPSFDVAARFDHEDELGATATWSAPPSLFVSPTGRFVASQSMGMKADLLGSPTAVNPLVRIWDLRHGEVARFRSQGPMLVAFSPRDDLAATLSYSVAGDGKSGVAGEPKLTARLELWRLSVPQAEVVRKESVFAFAMTKPRKAPTPEMPVATIVRETVWVGADRKLRMLDRTTGRIAVLDDLGPLADVAFAEAKEAVTKLMATMDRARRETIKDIVRAEDPYAEVAKQAEMLPPEFPLPLYPIVLSGDRQRVLVKLASTLRLYSLDEKRLISTTKIGDEILTSWASELSLANFTGASQMIVSHKGTAAAVAVTTFADAAKGMSRSDEIGHFTRHKLIFSFESNAPIGTVEQTILHIPGPVTSLPLATSRPLAISDDGRLLAMERLIPSQIGPKPQIQVVDPKTGHVRFSTPPSDHAFSILQLRNFIEAPRAAAFSAGGKYLVVEHVETACPPKIDMLPALLPNLVPSCPEWRTNLRLWDVASGAPVREVSFDALRWQPGASRAPSTPGVDKSVAPSLPPLSSSLALLNNEEVIRTNVDFALRPVDTNGELKVLSERISLERSHVLMQMACRRLPHGLRQISRDQWASALPGEAPRAICPEKNQ